MPTGSHGAFRDYQVDAVSLEFSPTFHVKNENAKSLFLLKGGRYPNVFQLCCLMLHRY